MRLPTIQNSVNARVISGQDWRMNVSDEKPRNDPNSGIPPELADSGTKGTPRSEYQVVEDVMRAFITESDIDDRLMRRIVTLLGLEFEKENPLFDRFMFVQRCFRKGVT